MLTHPHGASQTPPSTLHPEVAEGARSLLFPGALRRIATLRGMIAAQLATAPTEPLAAARARDSVCAAIHTITELERGMATL